MTLSGIREALKKLREIVPETPLLTMETPEGRIRAKDESAQPMRAFKLRGAWHRLTALSQEERSRGVVAFSSGNHAQGVAWAARKLDMPALIVMPADSPSIKLDGTRALGAEIVTYDRMTQSREVLATQIAAERGAVLVPSFDDPWVVEGQGSLGLEAILQLGRSPDTIIVPCGGGGLAAGVATACPDARIIIAEPEGWDDMGHSLRLGEIVPVLPNPPETRCDALQTLRVSPLTFDILRSRKAEALAVPEAAIVEAMRFAWQHHGLRLEPGGAIALAAVLSGLARPHGETLIVLSGGNVDPDLFARLVGG